MDSELDFLRGVSEIATALQAIGAVDPSLPAKQAERRTSYLLQQGSIPGTRKIKGLGWVGSRSAIADGFRALFAAA